MNNSSLLTADRMTQEGLVLWLISRYLGGLSPEERRAIQRDIRYLRVDYRRGNETVDVRASDWVMSGARPGSCRLPPLA